MASIDFSPRIYLTVAGFIYSRFSYFKMIITEKDGGKYEG